MFEARLSLLLACLLLLETARAAALIYSDADMGIHTFSFPFDTGQQQHELRVHLRVLCPRQQQQQQQNGTRRAVQVKGFAGVLPIASSSHHNVTVWDPHFKAPEVQQQQQMLFVSGAGGRLQQRLLWVGPSHQGLWRLQGQYQPTGADVLTLNGSGWQHELPDPRCSDSSSSSGPGRSPRQWAAAGIWNVVTTTSPNSIPPQTLAHMMAMHAAYHRRLGINGTVLRCNPGEARALAGMHTIQQAVAAAQLIIWPWEEEHSVSPMPFYWQKPRNQLTLLAAFGAARGLRLVFLDLDEYLVLPHGKPLQASSCRGRPLLAQKHAALSFIRYPARSCSSAKGSNPDGGGGSSGNLGAVSDLACWNSTGRPLPTTSEVALAVERCPCQFHKPLVQPDRVVTLSVHFVWTELRGQHKKGGPAKVSPAKVRSPARASYVVPHDCGFILHLHALVSARKHFEADEQHIVAARWVLAPSGAGEVEFPGGGTAWLRSEAECRALRPDGVAPENMALSWC